MLKFKLINLAMINGIGLKLNYHKKLEDERGYLKVEAENNLADVNSIIIKESFSKALVARGLHLQSDLSPQTKIIQVQSGKILDVVFDPKNSLQTIFGFYLSDIDDVSVTIPPSFAHGFIALQPTSLKYICLGKYSESNETTFNVLGNISKIMNLGKITLSKKDKTSPKIKIFNSLD